LAPLPHLHMTPGMIVVVVVVAGGGGDEDCDCDFVGSCNWRNCGCCGGDCDDDDDGDCRHTLACHPVALRPRVFVFILYFFYKFAK
jgi:hypothetical protein